MGPPRNRRPRPSTVSVAGRSTRTCSTMPRLPTPPRPLDRGPRRVPMTEGLPPEAFLAGYPDAIREGAEVLRRVVRRAVPDAVERVRPGWRLIGYDLPVGGRLR